MSNGQEIIDPLSLNLYTYCANNPIRYIDPSGHKRVDKDFTWDWSVWDADVKKYNTVTYNITQAKFTNLNVTLYTIDGTTFHTDIVSLINGEKLWMNDPTGLIKSSKYGTKNDGTWVTSNLNTVTKMDKELGSPLVNFGKAGISLVSDATMVFGWFAKAIGAAGSTGIKIVSNIGTGADVVSYSWSGAESAQKLAQGELNSFNAFLEEASGYIPIYGTYKDFESALNNAGYTVTFK